jgi:hypothetical protein
MSLPEVIFGEFGITTCRFSSCNTLAATRFTSRWLDVSNRLIEVRTPFAGSNRK